MQKSETRVVDDQVVDDEGEEDEERDDDAGRGDVAEDPLQAGRRQTLQPLRQHVEDARVVAERTAVPRRLQPHDGVRHLQHHNRRLGLFFFCGRRWFELALSGPGSRDTNPVDGNNQSFPYVAVLLRLHAIQFGGNVLAPLQTAYAVVGRFE